MRYAVDMLDMTSREARTVINKYGGNCSIDDIGNFVGLFKSIEAADACEQEVTLSVKEKGIWKVKR